MVEYTKVNVTSSDSQIKKLKDALKDNTGTTLKISLKMFNGNKTTWIITHNKTKNKNKKCLQQI